MQKYTNNYKKFAKTQAFEAIKIISCYMNIVFLFQLLFILIQFTLCWRIK